MNALLKKYSACLLKIIHAKTVGCEHYDVQYMKTASKNAVHQNIYHPSGKLAASLVITREQLEQIQNCFEGE